MRVLGIDVIGWGEQRPNSAIERWTAAVSTMHWNKGEAEWSNIS